MDGITEEDIKKIDKSVLGLATALGTTYAKAYFPGNKALSSSLGPIALATSTISGFMTGWDFVQNTELVEASLCLISKNIGYIWRADTIAGRV